MRFSGCHSRAKRPNRGAQQTNLPRLCAVFLTALESGADNTRLPNGDQSKWLYYSFSFKGFSPFKLNSWLGNCHSQRLVSLILSSLRCRIYHVRILIYWFERPLMESVYNAFFSSFRPRYFQFCLASAFESSYFVHYTRVFGRHLNRKMMSCRLLW